MRKLLLLLIIISLFVGCSGTKVINGKNHTFVSYVILNSDSDYVKGNFANQPLENFPLNRLLIWNKED